MSIFLFGHYYLDLLFISLGYYYLQLLFINWLSFYTGGNILLEVFMFVNPIGGVCLDTESNIIQSLNNHQQKARINVVPLTNLQIVTDYLRRSNLNLHDLELRNHIANVTYQSLLDYKAASFQGKKKAREFLLNLQKHINKDHEKYSDELVNQAATEAKLEIETFNDDRHSKLVKELCEADRQLASELKVSCTPSTVLVDYRHNIDGDGILIEGHVDRHLMDQIIEDRLHDCRQTINQKPFQQLLTKNHDHLRLL